MIEEYDRESRELEPDYNEPPPYDSSKPTSIFNHPPFSSMSLREFDEWARESWL